MARGQGESRLPLLLAWVHRIEDLVLALLLILTLGAAFGQIVLRNLFGTSIIWADTLVRIMVLWLGMLGAMIATRQDKHIGIDLISRYLSLRRQRVAEAVVSLFAGGVCLAAAWFSLIFVIDEYHAGEAAFATVPAWLCVVVLPTAFGIIAIRYFIQGVMTVNREQEGGAS